MRYRHYAPKTPLKLFKTLEATSTLSAGAAFFKENALAARTSEQGLSEGSPFPLKAENLYALLYARRSQTTKRSSLLCQERESALSNRLLKAASLI